MGLRRRFETARPPILDVITAWQEGPPPVLPDEVPDDGRTIRWAAGALDGVQSRDGDPARGAALAALIERAAAGDAEATGALYEAARADGIVRALDEALDALERADVRREPVADLGRQMVRQAQHREPLKLAVALVGRAGDGDDVPLLETLARHDEFSVVAGAALANVLRDPVQAWWRVGCLATGWGKVEAVTRLAATPSLPEDVRGWMLRHGCENEVLPEYLAYACATSGRLEDALDGLVDDELLDGACTIVRALVNGGPAEDIADYEPGPRVAAAVVELVAERPPSVGRLTAVVDIRRWAEDFEEHVAIAERCGRVLDRPAGRAFVTGRLERLRRCPRRLADRRGDGARPVGAGLAPPPGRAGGLGAVPPARPDPERGALRPHRGVRRARAAAGAAGQRSARPAAATGRAARGLARAGRARAGDATGPVVGAPARRRPAEPGHLDPQRGAARAWSRPTRRRGGRKFVPRCGGWRSRSRPRTCGCGRERSSGELPLGRESEIQRTGFAWGGW